MAIKISGKKVTVYFYRHDKFFLKTCPLQWLNNHWVDRSWRSIFPHGINQILTNWNKCVTFRHELLAQSPPRLLVNTPNQPEHNLHNAQLSITKSLKQTIKYSIKYKF